MRRLTLLLIVFIIVSSYSSVSAQASGNLLAEDEMPPNLIAKHFSNDENSSLGKWYQDGPEFYYIFCESWKTSFSQVQQS